MTLWWVDILILIVISYNLFMGLRRGFIRSIVDLIGLYMASILGMQYGASAIVMLYSWSGVMLPYPQVTGFLIVWVAVFLSMAGLGLILDRLFSMSFLGPMNLVGGGFFGAAKGLVFILPVVIPILFFRPTWLDSSILIQTFRPQLDPIAAQIFSEENREYFTQKISESNLVDTDKLKGVDISKLGELSGELSGGALEGSDAKKPEGGWGNRWKDAQAGSADSLLERLRTQTAGSDRDSLEEIQKLLQQD